MRPVHAIFENGIFRPLEKVDLPERCEVVFEPQVVHAKTPADNLDKVYAILSERYNSGQSDVAARHNDHQP